MQTNKKLILISFLAVIIVMLYISSFPKKIISSDDKDDTNFKIHVSYVHYIDSNSESLNENFKFFLHFAVQPCDSRVDYRITLNTNNINVDINAHVANILADDELMSQINNCSNVVLIKNSNTRDLCVHAEQVKSKDWKKNKQKYKYFFFINSSTRGPFLPNYWTEPWWNIFTNKFMLNPKLAATGPYLSTEVLPHIQSFFVALDMRGLNLLETIWRCQNKEEIESYWIRNTEVVC